MAPRATWRRCALTHWSTNSACTIGSASCRRSRTTSCRPTTARPTSWSCRAGSESFGLVALEAAACGIPVVASAVGGLLTLVDHGRHRRLIEGRDPGDYARGDHRNPRRRRWSRTRVTRCRRAGAALHVELRSGPSAPLVRRPHGSRAGHLSMTDARRRRPARRPRRSHRRVARRVGRRTRPHPRRVDRHRRRAVRWYVRMRGDDKDFTTVWFTLGQRTLRYETYVMPAPEENDGELYEHLLRRNEHARRRTLLDRGRGRGVPARRAAGGTREPRRTRSCPRHAVRGGRTVLPGAAAHRLPQPLRLIVVARSFPSFRSPLPFPSAPVVAHCRVSGWVCSGESVPLSPIRTTGCRSSQLGLRSGER